jgi:hypothetical protein
MALNHVSKVFAVKDAKVRKILTDPAGGSTTKGTSYDVPGIKTVTISGDVNGVELRGDNQRLDYQAILTGIKVEFEYAKLSLDILGVVLGPTVTDSGTTPNQISTLALTGANSAFAYFEFEAQAVGADTIGGDASMILYKCILDSFPDGLGMAEEDYATYKMSAQAMPRLSDQKWIDVVLHETAVALA